jgi:7,8-didemethyl-8-hydroxy-5-deazariboflavin synthase CofG subunit
MTGERPEARFKEARNILKKLGYKTTVEYLRDMCELVVKRTGILPHSNPGTMTKKEMAELREVNASMGLMLENVSPRLCEAGGPHEKAPSKHPKVRLAVIEHAGQLMIPFTTGVLIGIGETPEEIVDSLYAIKELHSRYGHIQEVIIQNFRAKPGTPMSNHPEPTREYMLRAIALARLIMGGEANIQAPPNLSSYYPEYLDAGINDWGGVSPVTLDYVNPEAPWPQVSKLREVCRKKGFRLRQRLPVYPEYVLYKRSYLPGNLKDLIILSKADVRTVVSPLMAQAPL